MSNKGATVKKLKASELMLKGFAMAGGKQCFGRFCIGDPKKPSAVCVVGAFNLAAFGNANQDSSFLPVELRPFNRFLKSTGVSIMEANDVGMSIPDIAGILASEGY
jgi:hypothetical protein